MLRSRLIFLLLTLLLTAFTSPAFARMVIGVTPAVMPGAGDPGVLRAFEDELSSRLGGAVQVRSFDSETTQLDWLIRFRELDAALVSRSLPGRLPAGTLLHLADLSSAVAVTHPGATAAHSEKLGRALRNLLEDERGRLLLSRLAGTAKVAAMPKSEPARQPAQPVAPAPAKPAALAPMESRAVAAQPTQALPTAKPAAVAASQPASPPAAPPTAPSPPAAPAIASPAPPSAVLPPAPAPIKQPVTAATPDKAQPAAPSPAEPANPKRTLLLFAALVVLTGIGVKVMLLMRHWEQQKKNSHFIPEPPKAATFELLTSSEQAVTVPSIALFSTAASTVTGYDQGWQRVPALTEPAAPMVSAEPAPAIQPPRSRKVPRKTAGEIFPPVGDGEVVEQGRLGKVKVPSLLRRCADLPQPTILRVRSGDNETCVHFAAGQICHAYSRNWRNDEGPGQWGKLGYLMVRDGLISEAQRDQALELLERHPGLRFAAALQKLDAIDLEALRHILARQAKTTVFALILFYSGAYRVEVDRGAIPAEESIALQVEALIREASHHQAEWTAIRKVLPSLGTLLDFAPDGREKLEQVRLSVHQQLLLSQIDGQTSVGTLSSGSTMMDYEACRFLYLMVKAGVLQVMPAS